MVIIHRKLLHDVCMIVVGRHPRRQEAPVVPLGGIDILVVGVGRWEVSQQTSSSFPTMHCSGCTEKACCVTTSQSIQQSDHRRTIVFFCFQG